MKLYRVCASVTHHTKDSQCRRWANAKQIPTFLLDGGTLGIVDEAHAEQIARKIILPVDLDYDSVTVNVCVVAV